MHYDPFRHLFAAAALFAVAASPAFAADPVSFSRDVKPILSARCFACHGSDANKRKAKMRLDVAPENAADWVVAPGDRQRSELYYRITATDEDDRMPPSETGPPLSAEEQERIGRWIDAGGVFESHWSFSPPEKGPLPPVADQSWPRNDIDRFILARLESEGISPSPEAAPTTLLRRVHLDLTGIPPNPEEITDFLAQGDTRSAYETVVDKLLASPHFGERWGRHWLDAARYADSNGYSVDGPRKIWKYRDWVINAFNADLPFDQFTIDQLAGDLVEDATIDQRIATGFHRNTMINQEGGVDPEEFRLEAVLDRVNTTGSVFFGLTLGCARCHTHKFDPIAQDEYYGLAAFFNNDNEITLETPTPEQAKKKRALKEEVDAIAKERDAWLTGVVETAQPAWEATLLDNDTKNWDLNEKKVLATPREERSKRQERMMLSRFKRADPTYKAFEARIAKIKKKYPAIVTTLALERRAEPRETKMLIQGDYTRPGEVVAPGTPAALHSLRKEKDKELTRLDFAKWVVDPANPMTARVTVNRFWQRLFGRGLVETENDLGSQGTPPSHPALLDYLALRFIENGWSMKTVLREMTTSATYQQASTHRADLQEVDPENLLLARQNRIRLDAEIIRDSALAASGLLVEEIGGPSVYPPQPAGVMNLGQIQRNWQTSTGSNRYRRGLYTFFWRATPYPALTVFDAPDGLSACTRRNRSNTPLQALTLLNDEAFYELAQGVAARIATDLPEAGDAARSPMPSGSVSRARQTEPRSKSYSNCSNLKRRTARGKNGSRSAARS